MSLRDKLARLSSAGPGGRPPGPPPTENAERVAKLRGLLSQMIADEKRRLRDRVVEPATPPAPLPGESIDTPYGAYQRVCEYLEPSHCHGRIPIAQATRVCPRTIAKLALDEELEGVDPSRMLFVDTETTGLSGGSGTIPFLIGLAWFEDESLRVEQLLLPAPGLEVPMLRRLAERIDASSALVTYNGKAFDWPLLRNRFVLNRVPVATPAAHLDLLHCARRVYKRRLGQVRLVNLEESVLGMRRERDIDGAEIPALFWELVRGGDGSVIAPVVEHNANDLIALAAILVRLVEIYEGLGPEDEPADRLGVAQVAKRAADVELAGRWATAAAEGGGPQDVTADALWLAAELARERGDVPERRELLHRGLEAATRDEARAARFHLALAKLYEHHLKDFEAALIHARASDLEEGAARRDHRVARILVRLERARRQVTLRSTRRRRRSADA
ncbi:MAG: ribonuclease H-like domain-containing protein [Sandaracinaceae bacterium]|nr:ribonuclease H-like domain-containing protein [Sandaracinaceae bacterium]